jgi:hypothetical protein
MGRVYAMINSGSDLDDGGLPVTPPCLSSSRLLFLFEFNLIINVVAGRKQRVFGDIHIHLGWGQDSCSQGSVIVHYIVTV